MNKVLLFITFITVQLHAQSRFEVTSGKIEFTSDAPMEIINASTEKTPGIIDPVTRQFGFIVKSGSFTGFNSEIQREHFNEKYMESEKYYQSTFSGVIMDSINFHKDGIYKVKAKGSLMIHGRKQPRIIPGTITISKGVLTLEAEFKILLKDHDIAIPTIVNQKIASEIYVKLKFSMVEKEKTGKLKM